MKKREHEDALFEIMLPTYPILCLKFPNFKINFNQTLVDATDDLGSMTTTALFDSAFD